MGAELPSAGLREEGGVPEVVTVLEVSFIVRSFGRRLEGLIRLCSWKYCDSVLETKVTGDSNLARKVYVQQYVSIVLDEYG